MVKLYLTLFMIIIIIALFQIVIISMMANRLESAGLEREFLELMKSEEIGGWVKGSSILQKMLTNEPELSVSFKDDILRSINKINSLMMLLLVYSHGIKPYSIYSSPYREQLITLRLRGDCYRRVLFWLLQQQDEQIRARGMQLVLQNFSGLLANEMLVGSVQDFQLLLRLLHNFKMKREREVGVIVNLMVKLQKLRMNQVGQYQTKEIAIIRLVCQILAQNEGRGNLGLVFDENLLGEITAIRGRPNNIDKFCNMHCEYLLSLSVPQLLKIFRGLIKAGITCFILQFFNKISRILVHQQQFYKLMQIYRCFILPELLRRTKMCTKDGVALNVVEIAEFYIYGFSKYFLFGKEALQCILENIQRVTPQVRQRLILIAKMVVEGRHDLQNYLQNSLKQKKLYDMKVDQDLVTRLAIFNQTWQIPVRSMRCLKSYKMFGSDLKGIVNRSSQCYIISIVQALFMTKRLSVLLSKAKAKQSGRRVIDNLWVLFQQLASGVNRLPNVDRLKQEGPRIFALSENQQDAQSYLIELMQQIQKELKKQGLLDQLKKIFEIQIQNKIICPCGYKKDDVQQQYAHTLAHGQKFQTEGQQILLDYKCSKCGKSKCIKKTKIKAKGNIFIMHINRFSNKGGSIKKQLATQSIQRKIGQYQLVGMVFHIGKAMQNGHYVYYSKVGKKRWAEMNDTIVRQFQIEKEDEQFQKEFKSEKTPYILFYKKGSDK